MKNRKKSWALMGVVVACGLVLAACDGGASTLAAADPDQTRDEGPVVAPAPTPSPAVPQELLDRLATLEEEIAAKAANTVDKDAAVTELEAEIEKLKKALKKDKQNAAKAVKELKKKLEDEQREAREARREQEEAEAEAEAARLQAQIDAADQAISTSVADMRNTQGASSDGEKAVDDELLKNAKISVAFTTISDVGETPALKSKKLKSVDDWLCVVFFKNQPDQAQVTEECEGGDCYDKVMNGIVKGADARACYHVEGCWDEDNDGVGGDGIQDDISNCTAKRGLVVKNPETTKLSDINHAYILAHDEGGDDFNFTIDRIDIFTANAEAQLDGVDNASVAENFLFIFVDNVDWTKK